MDKSKCKGYGYMCEKRNCNECDQYEGPDPEELEEDYCKRCDDPECWDCPDWEEEDT